MIVPKPPLRLVIGAAAALAIANSVGVALAPALLTHSPLLLLALSPLTRHLVLVATRVELVPFLLIALSSRMLGATLAYVVGHAYGEQGLVWVQTRHLRTGRLLRLLERGFRRAAVPLLFVWPRPLGCALAGAVRMPAWLAALVATAGQAMWITITYRLGEKYAALLEPVVEFFREHMVSTTLVCVAAVVLYRWWRRGRRNAELRAPDLAAPKPTGEP